MVVIGLSSLYDYKHKIWGSHIVNSICMGASLPTQTAFVWGLGNNINIGSQGRHEMYVHL